jgi:septal ring factor EnvC (AmiA/AmiB activator)
MTATSSNPFRPISPQSSGRYATAAAARRLLAQLKAQEEAISAATRKLRETQDTLNQLNKQIDEMNASIAKLERQRATQERNLPAQLDAAFRQGPHTGIQMILSGEEGQRNQRMQAYFGYLNQARQETIAQLKQTREEVATQKAELEEKQSQQQTLVYEQKAQQAKLEQARNERENPFRPGVLYSARSAAAERNAG